MPNVGIIGTQWGDEGKGKIIHLLAQEADFVCRYQGGDNAGHTVISEEKKYVLHLLPSGILYPGVKCVIGNGVVINPYALLEEIRLLKEANFKIGDNLFISDRAMVIFPYHRMLDEAKEQKKKGKIGTTKRGIGPCYMDKVDRLGIRMCDLLDQDILAKKLKDVLFIRGAILKEIFGMEPPKYKEIIDDYLEYGKQLKCFVTDTALLVNQAIDEDKKILFEGAQGVLLDVDFGTYPYVTSSNPVAGGICTGLGIGPNKIQNIIGVAKAYTTRVGEGPFPTELKDDIGAYLRKKGGEFGATTARPRRCGWFDAVAVRHSILVSGIESLTITKLDVLDELDKIRVCIGYKYQDKEIYNFPAQTTILPEIEPIYKELPGWKTSTQGIRNYADLPAAAKDYLSFISKIVGRPISIISTGADRDETIIIKGVWK